MTSLSESSIHSDSQVRSVDSAFTLFVTQYGPIASAVVLLDFLKSIASVASIPDVVLTLQHIDLCNSIWNEANGTPITRQECHELIGGIQELEGVAFILPEEVERIFSAVTQVGDFLPCRILTQLLLELAAPVGQIPLVEELAAAELCQASISCADLMELCDVYLWLSTMLSANAQLIVDAAILADGGDVERQDARVVVLSQVLSRSRQEHAAERLANRAKTVEHSPAQARRHGASMSIFYPQSLVATDGLGNTIPSLLAAIPVSASNPRMALDMTSRLLAPHALVRRVADLRKNASEHDKKREQKLRDDIVHAAYDATELAPLGSVLGSKPDILRAMDLEGVGERAGRRLHPHELSPKSSIRCKLSKALGVDVTLASDAPRRNFSAGSQPVGIDERALFQFRNKQREEQYLQSRRRKETNDAKKRRDRAAGFFSASLPRTASPNFDSKMEPFFTVHPKAANPNQSRLSSTRPPTSASQPKQVNSADLQHELRIILCDAQDALRSTVASS